MKRETKRGGAKKDEVEELLQAAQDDMLLKLSVDSHLSRGGVSLGDADIDRRFHALKHKTTTTGGAAAAGVAASKAKSNSTTKSKSNSTIQVDEELKAVLGDDLSTRFAALKASLPMPSSATSSTTPSSSYYYEMGGIDNEEDEVEKLMRWAKDAARLDPSPPSDDDDQDVPSESDDDQDKSESDEGDVGHVHHRDHGRKGKGAGR